MKRLLLAFSLSAALCLPALAAGPYPDDPQQYVQWKNVSSTPAAFALRGGQYAITVHAGTWSSGSVVLQRLAPDGATYVNVMTALTADGYATVNLPTGTYQLSITTATGVYADVVSVILGAAQ